MDPIDLSKIKSKGIESSLLLLELKRLSNSLVLIKVIRKTATDDR
jgi:hypothetical protein